MAEYSAMKAAAKGGLYLVSFSLVFFPVMVAIAQNTSAEATASQSAVTTVEVIVTGSNIPTAEDVGPQPVDTYRREDIARLGVRNATDLAEKLPAALGASINDNIAN
ncbi:MAG TPA: hypothetical protein VIH43_03765, partial [Chthoniobacterales bacterium]